MVEPPIGFSRPKRELDFLSGVLILMDAGTEALFPILR
jgi:hypothetical protein